MKTSKRIAVRVLASLLAVGTLGAGCGGAGALSGDAQDNDIQAVRACVHRQGKPKPLAVTNKTGKALALVVTKPEPQTRLIAYDLAAKSVLWDEKADVTSRVTVGPDAVFAREGEGTLVARDVATGKKLWSHSLKGKLLGAAADGGIVVYSAQIGESQKSVLVALNARSGGELWNKPAKGIVGAPAARSGEVFVPYLSQYLTVMDASSGKEVARIRQKDEAITFVRANDEGVFYGGTRVYQFDEASCTGNAKEATQVQASLPKDFAGILYHPNGYSTVSANYTAIDRNRLVWQGDAGNKQVQFAGNIAVVQFYRFFFGFEPASGKLSWAHIHPRVDVVSSESSGAAIYYISSEGELAAVDIQTGNSASLGKLDARAAGATFDIGGVGAPAGEAAGSGQLARELAKIVWDPDRRYDQIKVFAVDALSQVDGAEVSGELLKIVIREGIKPEIYRKAGDALVARKDKSAVPAMIEQLGIQYDHVTNKKAVGVDVIARALAAMEAIEAAPRLIAHFEDPQTSSDTVAAIAAAFAAIKAEAAVPALSSFVLAYRADPAFASDPAAIAASIEALAKLGGQRELELLEFVAEDEASLEKVRAFAQKVLADTEARRAKDTGGGGQG